MKRKFWPFRIQPSTRSFAREARRTPGYSLLDWLHGYIYIRWPYLILASEPESIPWPGASGRSCVGWLGCFSPGRPMTVRLSVLAGARTSKAHDAVPPA